MMRDDTVGSADMVSGGGATPRAGTAPSGGTSFRRPTTADPWLPPFLAAGGTARWALANLIVAVGYGLLGEAVGRFFAAYGLFPAPIWLPSSVAVVAAMMGGLRLLPGIALGSFAINYAEFGSALGVAALISAGNALGPVAAAALNRRLRPTAGLFNRFAGVVSFVLCAVLLAPALTASGGTLALALSSQINLEQLYATWMGWWLSDSGGALCFAPALLLWLGVEQAGELPMRRFDRGAAAVWGGVALIALALFAAPPWPQLILPDLPFLLVVPLAWIALRMSLRAAYSLVSAVSVIACAGTVAGLGPFQAQTGSNPLQLVGVLIVLLTMTVLTIVALFSERRAAEAASRAKSMLIASTSHDLRTPLTAIIGFAQMIRAAIWGPLENAHYRDYVEHIHSSAHHLLDLINDILDLAKIEAGSRRLAPAWLDGRAAIEACLGMVGPSAAAKQLASEILAADGARLYADARALQQILLNLLSNAIKFTPEGGRIALRLVTEPSGNALLEVADTGIGMDEAGLRTALQPFGQVADAPAAGGTAASTGLGLPIAARLTEQHGGSLTLTSAPGQGTVVRLSFPAPRG